MGVIILSAVCVLFMLYYLLQVVRVKFDVRTIVVIALFVALSAVLGYIKLYRFPQGGSMALASMLPILLIAIFYGPGVGMTAGLVAALLGLIDGPYIIHWAQFMFDYILPYMVFGIAGIFGQSKPRALAGAALACLLSLFCNVLSGVIFFAEYAPEGMNPWWYSISYNGLTNGLEMLLALVLLALLPLERLRKLIVKR